MNTATTTAAATATGITSIAADYALYRANGWPALFYFAGTTTPTKTGVGRPEVCIFERPQHLRLNTVPHTEFMWGLGGQTVVLNPHIGAAIDYNYPLTHAMYGIFDVIVHVYSDQHQPEYSIEETVTYQARRKGDSSAEYSGVFTVWVYMPQYV